MKLSFMRIMAVSVLFVFYMGASVHIFAMDGQTLAWQVYNRDDGKDSYATVRMLLLDKRGNKRFRTFISATKDYDNIEKSFIRFTSPADIEGTSFLTWGNNDRDDDQFLFLPALNRVRRIVSTQKASRFVNTDYTYEDMERRKPDQDRHNILREEKIDSHECWVLESIPRNPKASQYSKMVSWVSKVGVLPVKTEYYGKRGRVVKRLSATKIKQVDGIWSVTESEMHDLKKDHHTYMKTLELHYNRDIPDNIFTQAYMMHGS